MAFNPLAQDRDSLIMTGSPLITRTALRHILQILVGRLILLALVTVAGCTTVDFDLAHPSRKPPGVSSFEQVREKGDLRMEFYWSIPSGTPPFPTIVIHPGIEEEADDLRAVTWDLAKHGYVAVAVEYQRRVNGAFDHVTLPLRSENELTLALEEVRSNPAVDAHRLGLLGFSLGGTYTLLAAAHDAGARTVVAYYPITDFPGWVKTQAKSWAWRMMFRAVRWQFAAESPENNDAAHQQLLQRSSVMAVADRIRAPTLLIHGDRDRIVPVAQSEQLQARLTELNVPNQLRIMPGVGHSFNFIDRQPAECAWQLTIEWLGRYLPPASASSPAATALPGCRLEE